MTVAGYVIGFIAGGIAQALVKTLNQSVGIEILVSGIVASIGLLSIMAFKKITEVTE